MHEKNLKLVHEMMLEILRPLDAGGAVGFKITADAGKISMGLPVIKLNCCDTQQGITCGL